MFQIWLSVITLSAIVSLLVFKFSKNYLQTKGKHNLKPPGPLSFPIIGHLHLIKQPLHRSLQELSYKYGSIYSLKFGFRPVVVISSPTIVDECFTKHDIVLANRPRLLVGKHLNYDWTTLGAVSYGPLWRELRRITTLEFFSSAKLHTFSSIRAQEMNSLVKGLFEDMKHDFTRVEMRTKFTDLSFNIVMRMVTGKRYFGADLKDEEEAKIFQGIAKDVFELSGASNPVDCFPFLRWFDLGNIEERMLATKSRMDAFLDVLINECRLKRAEGENRRAVLYKLLDLQESDPVNYSDQFIKGIILIMLTAGIETVSVTMEWALSLLLNHPDTLYKARQEIDTQIGKDRLANEYDLPNLPWIRNIVNETLRLFPAVPLLSPHEPSEDCTIGGYHVKKGTMVLINAWGIHRNPNIWDDPLSFKPDRFEGKQGEEYRLTLIPFGLGRRSCPGAHLANRIVGLCLATLIQCFEWQKVGNEDVDLAEGFGLSMPKATPLEALYKARQSMIEVLKKL